jgi:hypothetical protein
MNTSDNKEYYNEPTHSDWAEYVSIYNADNDYTDADIDQLYEYYTMSKKALIERHLTNILPISNN